MNIKLSRGRRQLLTTVMVVCYLLYQLVSENLGDSTNNMGGKVNATKEVVVTAEKLPPIQGKVPVCTTPQNDCVKPFYKKPEKVQCLARQRQKIDSSGSWKLPQNFMYKFDQTFADAVVDRVISGTVLELGAGLGCYTNYFHDSGKISKIDAYEGAPNVEEMSEGFIKQADLTVKKDFGYDSYDWVLCMEVAEHIPKEFEPTFLLNIVSPAKKGVLLSWGIPGQNGIGHVNTRSNEYVIDTMRSLGFDFDNETSSYLRSQAQSTWFKGTTMVFLNAMNVD